MGQEKKAGLYSTLQERIAGTMLIKSFAKEKLEAIIFVKSFRQLIDLTIRQTVFGSISGFVNGSVNILVPTVITLYGGIEVMRGNLTIGGLIAFLGYIRYVYGPIQRLFERNMGIQTSLAALERVVEILEMESEEAPRKNKARLEEIRGNIQFSDVGFGYGDDRKVLSNISLEAHRGMILGIVGASGAGKTTLMHLVPRFYLPQEGAIYLDGRDINDIHLGSLRRSIGLVSQDVFLFSGSLRDNIAYADPKAPMEDVVRVAQMAQIHDFIMSLPEKYETQIGERGVKLSGGQRQRIAIARMVLADPRIVLLDEATSFLDTQTEGLVLSALKPWLRDRTVLLIAHRLSTIQDADQIILLNAGRLIAQGTHVELCSHSELYQQLYDNQFGTESSIIRGSAATHETRMDGPRIGTKA